MRIGLISDIHGNYEALKCVLGRLDEWGIKEVYSLGDVVGYYTQVNECCEELRNRGIPNLMGNHDWYVAGGGFCARSKSVNDCLVYQRKVITEDNLIWLSESRIHRNVHGIHMVHAGWTDPIDEYLWEPNAVYFSKVSGHTFASGHTHIQSLHRFGTQTYCNPGSVGQPRDNDPRAAFAVFDGEFSLHRVEYNMQPVFDAMKKAGFDDYYYGGLKTGAAKLKKLADC
jgi:predicted phosphodiesterase